MYKVSLKKIRRFNARQHCLIEKQDFSVSETARRLVGIHSARLPTPYFALNARLERFSPDVYFNSVYKKRDTIKIRCMRRTLHTIGLREAPILHAATWHLRQRDCELGLRKIGCSFSDVEYIKSSVISILEACPLDIGSILRCVFRETKRWPHGILEKQEKKVLVRWVVKLLWEEGILCYLNASSYWGGEIRLYGLSSQMYPSLDLNSMRPDPARVQLVNMHVANYGPVTRKDIAWWSGLTQKEVSDALIALSKHLVEVQIDELPGMYFMTSNRYEEYLAYSDDCQPFFRFLAYEDPSLKGYFESRGRYVTPEKYDLLFNQIGEARASMMVDGEVVGIWHWDGKKEKIDHEFFAKVPQVIGKQAKLKIEKMESNYGIDRGKGRELLISFR